MSLDNCKKCGLLIDTDEDPECYFRGIKDTCLCEDCQADFESLDLEDQLEEAFKLGDKK